MVELLSNSPDLNETLRSAASDLGLHCLPVTLLGISRLQWVKQENLNSKARSNSLSDILVREGKLNVKVKHKTNA